MKKNILGIFLSGALIMSACSYNRNPESGNYDPNDPGFVYEFEGDMYYSVPYDPMNQWDGHRNIFNKDSMNMREPAKGTIARGKLAYYYPYPNTNEGYEKAGAELHNPFANDAKATQEGKRLYELYCWHCHGKQGEGDGPLMASGKFPKPSWITYKSDYVKGLPDGKIYHVITNGRNLMGAHGSQVSPDQRWMIINYIRQLSGGKSANSSQPTNTNTQPQNADSTKVTETSKKS